MARCGVRCEYEQVSLLVVTVERIRAVGDPFRYGGQRQYMVPPEKTHETFVYCFAAAARFGRPGFRASGRFRNRGVPFRNRGVPFRSRGASFRNGSVLFRSRSVPLCSRGAPFCSRSVPLCSRGVAFRSRGFFRFRFRNLVFRPRFSVSRLSAAFVATAGCTFFRPFPLPPYALFRCRGFACRGGSRRSLRNYERIQLRDALFVLHLAVQLGRDAVAYEFERRPVLFAIGSAGSCGTFSGSIGVPFFQMR